MITFTTNQLFGRDLHVTHQTATRCTLLSKRSTALEKSGIQHSRENTKWKIFFYLQTYYENIILLLILFSYPQSGHICPPEASNLRPVGDLAHIDPLQENFQIKAENIMTLQVKAGDDSKGR